MAVNANNWHWVSKNCLNWAQRHVEALMANIAVEHSGLVFAIKTTAITGDVDLNQRKGKLLPMFDMAVTLTWEAKDTKDCITGKIAIPEIMHDTKQSEIVFDVSVDKPVHDRMRVLVRTHLVPLIRASFAGFSACLIEENSVGVYSSQEFTDVSTSKYSPRPVPSTETSVKPQNKLVGSVCTIKQSVEFVCEASSLYQALIDPAKASAWTRASAQISPKVNSQFSLFNGNIVGEIKALTENERIEMTWRFKTWPQGHYSCVSIELKQMAASTQLNLVQSGVPVGEKQSTQDNWNGYYWNSIKRTFGFGSMI